MKFLRRAIAILLRRERVRGLLLLVLVIAKGLADTVGVASIIPFLSVLGNPDLVKTNHIAATIYEKLGFVSIDDFVVALGLGFVALMLLSAVLRSVAVYAINRYLGWREHGLSTRLLENYLSQPYEFFLDRHSGDMSANILSETNRVVNFVYRPAIDLINHGLTFLFVTGFLIFADPFVTGSATVFFAGSYGLIYFSVRPVLRRTGDELVRSNRARFRLTSEVLTGVKQIKLIGREKSYIDRFSVPSQFIAKAKATVATLQQVPRFALEVLAFGGMILLTLVLLKRSGGVEADAFSQVIPVLGLFTVAGYRLMPAFQGIFASFTKLRLGEAPLDKVYADLMQLPALERLAQTPPEPMGILDRICIREISYTYPNANEVGLENISFEIQNGTTVGIVGSTGSGKTTLTDVILGLLRPQQGDLTVDGKPLNTDNIRSWQATTGYVPQDIFLVDASVAQNIALGLHSADIDKEKLDRATKLARIQDFIKRELPDGYETLIGERGVRLSGGQRQRIGIARALYHDPDCIVFDEATSALDNLTERELMDEINSLSGQKTVLVIAHRLSTVRECDKIIVLDMGRVVGEGTYDELKKSSIIFQKFDQIA